MTKLFFRSSHVQSPAEYQDLWGEERHEKFIDYIEHGSVPDQSRPRQRSVLSMTESELRAEIHLIESKERALSRNNTKLVESQFEKAKTNHTLVEYLQKDSPDDVGLSVAEQNRLNALRHRLCDIEGQRQESQQSYQELTEGGLMSFLKS